MCVSIFVSKWNEIVERNEICGNNVPFFDIYKGVDVECMKSVSHLITNFHMCGSDSKPQP